jgi:hypothetical protein
MAGVDTSSFQSIVLMLIGILVIILISNVLTIISNPDNIHIGAVVNSGTTGGEDLDGMETPKFLNQRQDPIYIDVEHDRLTIYPEETVIFAKDLLVEGNAFERFLDRTEAVKDTRYIVLMLRPDSAIFQRRLRRAITDRGIDIGFEPFDFGRKIIIE